MTARPTKPRVVPDEEEVDVPVQLFVPETDEDVIYVQRRDEGTKQWVFQFNLAPEEGTISEVARLRGGGVYRMQLVGPNNEGNVVIRTQRTIHIDGPPRKLVQYPKSYDKPDSKGQVAGSPAAGRVGIDDAITAGIINLLDAQGKASGLQMTAMQNMMQRPETNWVPLLVAFAPVVEKLIASRTGEKVDVLGIIKQTVDMVKEGTSQPMAFKDMINTMKEVLELKDLAAPVEAEEDPIMVLAKENLPRLLAVIEREQKRKGQFPTAAEVRTAIPGGVEGVPPVQPWQRGVIGYRKQLIAWAERAKDPEVCADFIFEMLPEAFKGSFREWLGGENAGDLLFQTLPELRNYEQWTIQCFTRLTDLFHPEPEPGDITEGGEHGEAEEEGKQG